MAPRSLAFGTSILLQALSLFSYERRVTVDARSRNIRIRTRRFWFLSSRHEIAFDRIQHLEYGYDRSWATDEEGETFIETFTISIVCDNPRQTVPLATFRGESSGDAHEIRALSSLEDLKRTLNVTVGRSVPEVADGEGVKYRCTFCKRNSPPRRRTCQYCGGPVQAVP